MKLSEVLIPVNNAENGRYLIISKQGFPSIRMLDTVTFDIIKTNNFLFKSELANIEYIYYYLILNKKLLKNYVNLTLENILNIDISNIPDIVPQHYITTHLRSLYDTMECTFDSTDLIVKIKKLLEHRIDYDVKPLSNLIQITDIDEFKNYIHRKDLTISHYYCFDMIDKNISPEYVILYLHYSCLNIDNIDNVLIPVPNDEKELMHKTLRIEYKIHANKCKRKRCKRALRFFLLNTIN